jgi:hypothetical protein
MSHAEQYFSSLWEKASPAWRAGEVPPATMRGALPDPVDYCVSTVARLHRQRRTPIAMLDQELAELRRSHPSQFYYPSNSLHVTLLGCTPRSPARSAFSASQLERIAGVCTRVLQGMPAVHLSLRGLGLVGNQVFVQVFPHSDDWARLRSDLVRDLRAEGEAPIAYPDTRPIHLNVMRLTDGSRQEIAGILELVQARRNVDFGEFVIDTVDLLITDFVLSEPSTTFLRGFPLTA